MTLVCSHNISSLISYQHFPLLLISSSNWLNHCVLGQWGCGQLKSRWIDGVDKVARKQDCRKWLVIALDRHSWQHLLEEAKTHPKLYSQWWWCCGNGKSKSEIVRRVMHSTTTTETENTQQKPYKLTRLQWSCNSSATPQCILESFQNLMCYFIRLLSYNTSIHSLFLQSSTSDVQAFWSNVATRSMHEAQLLSLSNIRQATANTDQMYALSSTSYIRIQFRWAYEENKKTHRNI